MYSNVDGLLNKKDDLISIIEDDKPLINALGENKPKRQYDFNIAEYNIPGYTLFVNHKIKRGEEIYAHVSLNAQLFNTLNDSGFEESVWCQFSTLNNTMVYWDVFTKVPMQLSKMRKLYLVCWNYLISLLAIMIKFAIWETSIIPVSNGMVF